ncbi:hypothetical protein AGMMS50284_6880 [Clostridia bacterium]|nr:hypothetical protein AGMMS50284_6880 [Clostridia bacterium]
MIQLVDRDYKILNEITRFHFCLGRQLKILAGFDGSRACDRRLKKLVDAGYIERKYLVFGIPGLYFATPKAKPVFSLEYTTSNVRIEHVVHDIAVIDTAIFFMHSRGVSSNALVTERELKHKEGFGSHPHKPDFVFQYADKTYAVEVELTTKKKEIFENNVRKNYMNYDKQIWIIPENKTKIWQHIEECKKSYSGIETIKLGEVNSFVKEI